MTVEYLTRLVPNTDPTTRDQVAWTGVDQCDPTWADIEQAIRDIDGRQTVGVQLQAADDTVLSVGWAIGWYLCHTLPDMTWLVNPDFIPAEPTAGKVRPEQDWVSLDLVLRAASYFTRIGGRDPSLAWVPFGSLAGEPTTVGFRAF